MSPRPPAPPTGSRPRGPGPGPAIRRRCTPPRASACSRPRSRCVARDGMAGANDRGGRGGGRRQPSHRLSLLRGSPGAGRGDALPRRTRARRRASARSCAARRRRRRWPSRRCASCSREIPREPVLGAMWSAAVLDASAVAGFTRRTALAWSRHALKDLVRAAGWSARRGRRGRRGDAAHAALAARGARAAAQRRRAARLPDAPARAGARSRHPRKELLPMNLTDGFDLIDPASLRGERTAARSPGPRCAEHSPVHRCEPRDYPPFWAITRHADICEISKQPDKFLSRAGHRAPAHSTRSSTATRASARCAPSSRWIRRSTAASARWPRPGSRRAR